LQWRYNSSQNWKLPFYYLRRPVRFGIGLLRYRTGQTSGAQTSPPSTNEGVG
jgi:hypothetical protein